MTNDHDPDALPSLFSRARRHDERLAPDLDDLLSRKPARPSGWSVRPALLWGGAGLLASVAAAALALVLLPLQVDAPPPVVFDAADKAPATSVAVLPPPADSSTGIAAGGAGIAPADPASRQSAGSKRMNAPPPASRELAKKLDTLGYLGSSGGVAGGVPGGVVGGVLGGVPQGTQAAEGDGNPNVQGARSKVLADEAEVRAEPAERAAYLSARLAQNKDREAADQERFNTERYGKIQENDFLSSIENPLSTFSIDVDTASYSVVRRYLNQGQLPPRNAVRIEELVNYFPYTYPQPRGDEPFSVNVEIASCPWAKTHRLARIGLHGREERREGRGTNLVFLVDVSGSMDSPEKLPLLQSALSLLVDQLGSNDQVAIVVYAGASGLVLPSTPGSRTGDIRAALGALRAGGSTNGGEGLALAYRVAQEHFIAGGVNRVILATDGDFNVGVTDQGELMRMVEEQAKAGVALTTLGFGMGNYNDDMLETLADHGNGNHFYIDDEKEARKVLVQQIGGTLVTIAKDVKIQVEFNPGKVGAYRLLGYENRMLRKEDFNDDRKDAGEIGSGHDVTALYELVPAGEALPTPSVDPLRYQAPAAPVATSNESFTVKLRYKDPDGETSKLLSYPATDSGMTFMAASPDTRFAAAVAAFGMVLRDSPYRGNANMDLATILAVQGTGFDPDGYRREFQGLVMKARTLLPR